MKNFFTKNLSVLIISLVLVIIFVFGGMYSRYMTDQLPIHERDNQILSIVGDGDEVVVFEVEQLEKEYADPENEESMYQPQLVESYKVLKDSEEYAVVYVIASMGKNDGVVVAYAIEIETKILLNIEVLDNSETPDYYNRLNDSFFSQLNDKDLDDPVFKLDAVAGATLSSKAFEVGMKYARELFGRDFDFEVPNLPYEIIDLSRNFDGETLVEKPFIIDMVWGEDNTVFKAYMNNDFNVVEVIEGTEPTSEYIDLLATVLPNTDLVDAKTFITAYDSTTKMITIESVGFGGDVIIVTAEFNAELNAFVNMTIQANQSYDQSYDYSGGNPPAVENAYKNAFLEDGTIIDGFAGATVTSDAMDRILTLAKEVLVAWNGGN